MPILPDPGWLPIALAVVLAIVELPTFRGRRAEATERDRGSKRLFLLLPVGTGAAFTVAFSLRPGGSHLGEWAALAALPIFALGAALRLWAVFTLGRLFTRTVQVSSEQSVIERGPYRAIRHPSYTGAMLEFIAVGLALRNWISLAILAAAVAAVYGYRIATEEQALACAIGEPYRSYMRRTKRLIPFIF